MLRMMPPTCDGIESNEGWIVVSFEWQRKVNNEINI